MTLEQILAEAFKDRDRFRALLIAQAEMHDDHARTTRDERARQGAVASRNACLAAYDDVGHGTVEDLCTERRHLGKVVTALNVAGKMLGVPPHERIAAILEWEARA